MVNQMPLRFRAVDPETGKASEVFEFAFDKQANGPRYSAFAFQPAATDGGSWVVVPASDVDDPILCQSTGLTDAGGVEIFSGDVLLSRAGVLWVVEWLNGGFVLANMADPTHLCGIFASVDQMTLLGNRWEPADVLKQRAREGRKG